jgi:hypothetical protein
MCLCAIRQRSSSRMIKQHLKGFGHNIHNVTVGMIAIFSRRPPTGITETYLFGRKPTLFGGKAKRLKFFYLLRAIFALLGTLD